MFLFFNLNLKAGVVLLLIWGLFSFFFSIEEAPPYGFGSPPPSEQREMCPIVSMIMLCFIFNI